jgi:hypothetical protein
MEMAEQFKKSKYHNLSACNSQYEAGCINLELQQGTENRLPENKTCQTGDF